MFHLDFILVFCYIIYIISIFFFYFSSFYFPYFKFFKEVISIDLDNVLFHTFHGLNHLTTDLDKSLHKNKSELDNTVVDSFLHELNNFFYKETNLLRLKELPENTLFSINEDTDDYIICTVNENTINLSKNASCIADDTFFIPKDICDFSGDESLFKDIDYVHEETYYKNYLQFKDGVYKVVDKNGNIL